MSDLQSPTSAVSNDPLEAQARAHLAARRFRKAREDFKVLCKKDRATFFPLLIEANIGLAQEMLAKGLVADAQSVVAYLKTIAPPEMIKCVELQLACKSGDATQITPQAVALLATGATMLSPSERLRWADQLVTAFAPVPADSPVEAQMAGEVGMIQQALEAISAGQNERALDLVRPLARDSAFSHWKLFIKGLAAFHGGEGEKAARCFDELPAESVPGRARASYQLLLGRGPLPHGTASEPIVEAAARLAGHGGWGRLLARSEVAWKARRYIDAYKIFRGGMPAFPSEGLELGGVLSEFFFNAIFTLPDEDRNDCEAFFLELEERNRAKNPTEQKLIQRTFCLLLHKALDPSLLKAKWEAYLRNHTSLHGLNTCLASIGYGWLGEVLAETHPRRMFDRLSKPRLRDAAGAIAALKQSIELDSTNVIAHLKLATVYESQKMPSQRNRLLDVMAERFPDDKEVLFRAGVGCLGRAAFVKGIEYFERALQLDRLDPRVPDLLTSGCLRLARHYFQKGRPERARDTLARIEELLVEEPENFLRNPWCHLTRRGLFEQMFGDGAQGAEFLARAREAAPFPALFLFFVHLAGQCYAEGKASSPPFQADFAAAANDRPTVVRAAALVRLFLFWKNAPDFPDVRREEDWLRQYLNGAAKQPFTREEAQRLVELLAPQEKFLRQAEALVKKVLKQDRRDPLFRFYQFSLQTVHLSDPNCDLNELQEILDEATRRGDEEAARLVRQAKAEFTALPPLLPPEWAEESDGFDNEDTWPFPPEFAPPDAAMMTGLLSLLSGLTDKEIAKLRKSRPNDIPAEMFDQLVDLAKGSGTLPPLPPLRPPARPFPLKPRRPPPSAPLPPTDPDQMNLF